MMEFLKRLSFGGGISASQSNSLDIEPEDVPAIESQVPVQEPVIATRRSSSRKAIVVLILGRSGSGKTFFVETACSEHGHVENSRPIRSTTEVTSRTVSIGRRKFELIDTPGFDNLTMSNFEVFTKLANYFLEESRTKTKISGIIYLHPAGDSLESRALARNLGVLCDVFLGASSMPCLHIMVVPSSGMDKDACAQTISRASLFRTLAPKALIVVASLDQQRIDDVLIPLASKDPILLRIQQEDVRGSRASIGTQIEERLGYFEAETMKLRVDEIVGQRLASHAETLRLLEATLKEKDSKIAELSLAHTQTKQHLETNEGEILALRQRLQHSQKGYDTLLSHLQTFEGYAAEVQSLQTALKDRDSKLSEYSQAYKHIKQQLATSREEVSGLRRQLQQTQSEYASLRSQLQLQENTEQSDIVQTLKDLNREIDEIGRLISEHLFDNHVQRVFGKEAGDVTTSDAHHLPELKKLLGHVDDRPSLVATSDGIGMPIEDFLDYATRVLLCKHLSKKIFKPFHPAVDSPRNSVVIAMYDDVQLREPQAVAAKWRANCFKSIHKTENLDSVAQQVDLLVRGFVDISLTPMLTFLFGDQAGITLEPRHRERLEHLFKTAWDWNSKLKGEVIVLGDFYPTCYSPTHRFDPNLMDEFDPGSQKSQSKYILGTLGLGLVSSRAVGGGRSPEVTVVFKATVAMSSLYA